LGKQWVAAAILLLAWVAVSAYFVVSGAPIDLPPEATNLLPYFAIVLVAGIIFFRFRKSTGDPELDRANLWAVLSGVGLLILLGFALATLGRDPHLATNWLYGSIAWAPIALVLIARYISLQKTKR
jgi:Na+/glutamate symporter